MPDMTMCVNSTCPLRRMCYRYRAVPDKYWQSFAEFKPDGDSCEYFWHVRGGRGVKTLEQADSANKRRLK